jgi:sugar phosphate isomerase/epimerase
MDLCPGRIGVSANQVETIQLAARFDFESVEPNGAFLSGLSEGKLSEILATLEEQGLRWGAAGLPVDFRHDEATFRTDLSSLEGIAYGLQRAGVTRIGTWLSPAHEELTYLENFKQHAKRLRAVADTLGKHGLRLGLEYVGPRTSWASKRYAFVHTLEETKELLAEIGTDNVGVVLDSWHWYTAEEDEEALASLTAAEVVAVDLNDAPAGIPVKEQIDNRRELPCATGVIDVQAFLTSLVRMGYDGPVRAEPFNQPLNALENEPAVKATAQAMQQAFALIA